MVSKQELGSDVDLIREFEELKIKQRLLIDNLRKNGNTQQNRLFLEINSKLDFLVKIFTEANKNEDEEEHNQEKAKTDKMLLQVDSLVSKIDTNFAKINDQVEKINARLKKIEDSSVVPLQSNVLSVPQDGSKDIPNPDFKVNIKDEEKPKKKWL